MKGPQIHPTAVVARGAGLADGVVVHPGAVIGEDVCLGEGTIVGPGCQIQGPTTIGKNNHFYGSAAIGTDPQDLKYRGEKTFLEIGDGNLIREFVTVNRGTEGGGGVTVIGSDNLLMTGVHVAHDCRVGDRSILANAATLAGHVLIDSDVTVGAFSGVHQFCRVGAHAFIGGYSVLTLDALPFIKTVGGRSGVKTYGINGIGLERKGFDRDRIDALKRAYRVLIRRDVRLETAVSEIRESEFFTEDVRVLVDFIESSERGVIR